MRITAKEIGYVHEVLQYQFRTSASPGMIKRFEAAFAEKMGARYAIAFANGTATLHAALVAAGVGPGDEVIVPPLTMASTAFCVLHAGAQPVFADVDPKTWLLDPDSVHRWLTTRTKAIIPVSLYGLPVELEPLMELARRKKLFILEDDAQCFLGRYRGRIVGSEAHAASFSFQSSKHISCGEGGAVTTDDEYLATRIRRLGSLGYGAVSGAPGQSKIPREVIQDPAYLRHVEVGWNYRLSELCAAVLLGQVERLDSLVQMRIDSAHALAAALGDCRWLRPQAPPPDRDHAYWCYTGYLTEDAPATWHQFRSKYLELGGDPFYGAWAVNYLEPALRGKRLHPDQRQTFAPGLCPVAERLQPRLLQFKTNYHDPERRRRAADALYATIQYFDRA